jgi:hypothetical protein
VARLVPVFEFILLIIHSNFSLNISIILVVGSNNIINVVHIIGFQTHSSADLQNCLILGTTFFCKWRMVLQTNIMCDCLGSFFMATSNLIKTNCNFLIGDTRKKMSN